MIIQLTDDEALTIADFLVKSVEAIQDRQQVLTPEIRDLFDATHQFVVQTWTQANEEMKETVVKEHRDKLKDIN
tara:strand:- start:1306 stop:1527 length:222 start_codon:yes stop_codon:yes gene_type:complete